MGFTETNARRPTLPTQYEDSPPDKYAVIVPGNTILIPGTSLLPATNAARVLEGVHVAIVEDAVKKAREQQLLDLGKISGTPEKEKPKSKFGPLIAIGLAVIAVFFFLR